MQTVMHKQFGRGEVIAKTEKEIGASIRVKFENGKELTLSIPDSFTLGIVTAEGDLVEEVETAIARRLEAKRQMIKEALEKPLPSTTPPRKTSTTRTTASKTKVTSHSTITTDYEAYLIEKGYSTETPGGSKSTVYSYIGAIEKHVLKTENISWQTLKENIDSIIAKYDVGGEREKIGAKSKSTVINALKRFRDFINS